MTRRASAAAVPVVLLLLAACTGDGPASAGRGPSGPGGGGPGDAAEAYFEAVAAAEFGHACELLAPVVRDRYAAAGQDCRTELAATFDERTRDAIGDVAVDPDRVVVTGDTAAVPGTAISRTDLPPGADAPSFPDLRATRQDGAWYLLP